MGMFLFACVCILHSDMIAPYVKAEKPRRYEFLKNLVIVTARFIARCTGLPAIRMWAVRKGIRMKSEEQEMSNYAADNAKRMEVFWGIFVSAIGTLIVVYIFISQKFMYEHDSVKQNTADIRIDETRIAALEESVKSMAKDFKDYAKGSLDIQQKNIDAINQSNNKLDKMSITVDMMSDYFRGAQRGRK